jgi:hypothetical protein
MITLADLSQTLQLLLRNQLGVPGFPTGILVAGELHLPRAVPTDARLNANLS